MKHNLWLFLALALCACSDTTAAGHAHAPEEHSAEHASQDTTGKTASDASHEAAALRLTHGR